MRVRVTYPRGPNLSVSPTRQARRSDHPTTRAIAEVVVATIGGVLLLVAVGANQRWLDRHFLPSFLLPRDWFVLIESSVRVFMAALGALLVFVARPAVGRLAERAPARALQVTVAAILAFAASEPMLRYVHLRPVEWLWPEEEPRRRPDPRLGWTFVPSRTGRSRIGGRVVEYAFDAAGYRVKRVNEPVDPGRPTILFTGESVMFGEGLSWEESVPAQVGAMMGMQSANLAVHGFGTDQSYLRLEMELPRFRQPVAVVSLFMVAVVGRNLDHERPHLRRGLAWQPPVQRWRLASLARLLVPYHSDNVVDEGVDVTREVLHATVALARARGATPLIVEPRFGHEGEAAERLRRRIADADLPYLIVDIDPAWRLPWDRHPDARGAHAIAAAIAGRLQHRR